MHTAFFGDAEHSFALPGSLIPELERTTGTGIGALSKRTMSGEFRYADVIEILRLSLIGGGMSPKEAAELLAAYADKTPIGEMFEIAVSVLEEKFTGTVTTIDTTTEEIGDE